MSQKIKNNQIKIIEIVFYMMKINKNKNNKKLTNVCLINNFGDYWKELHKEKQMYN